MHVLNVKYNGQSTRVVLYKSMSVQELQHSLQSGLQLSNAATDILAVRDERTQQLHTLDDLVEEMKYNLNSRLPTDVVLITQKARASNYTPAADLANSSAYTAHTTPIAKRQQLASQLEAVRQRSRLGAGTSAPVSPSYSSSWRPTEQKTTTDLTATSRSMLSSTSSLSNNNNNRSSRLSSPNSMLRAPATNSTTTITRSPARPTPKNITRIVSQAQLQNLHTNSNTRVLVVCQINSLDTPNTSTIFYRTLAASDDFPSIQFVEYITATTSSQPTDDVVYNFYLYGELLSSITNPSLSDLQSMITNSQLLMTQQRPHTTTASIPATDRFAARRHSQEFEQDDDEPTILSPPLDALSPRYAPQYSEDVENDTAEDVLQFNALVQEYEQTFNRKPMYNNLVGSSTNRTVGYLGLPPRPATSNLRQPPKAATASTLSAARLSALPKSSTRYGASESDRESIDTDVLEQYASQALQAANNALADDSDNRSTVSSATPITQAFNSQPNGRVGRSRQPAHITAAQSATSAAGSGAEVTTVITPAEADVLDALIVRDDPRVQRAYAAYPQLDLLIKAFLRLAREVVSINDRDEARDVVSRLGRSVSQSATNQTSRPSTGVSTYSTAPKLPTNQVFQTVAAELLRRRILTQAEINQLMQLHDNGSPLLESALQLFAADGDIGLLLERVTKLAKTASSEAVDDADDDEEAEDDEEEEEEAESTAAASQILKQHENALKNAHSQLVGNFVSFIEVFTKHGLLDNAEAVALLEALERGDEEVQAAFMTFSQDKDTTELIVKLKQAAADTPSPAAQQIQQRQPPQQATAELDDSERPQLDDVDVNRIEEHIVSLLPPSIRMTSANKQQLHLLIVQMDAEVLTAYHQVLDKVLKATHATTAASESAATITKAQQLEVLMAYKRSIDAFALLIARKLGITAASVNGQTSTSALQPSNEGDTPTAARQDEIESNVVTLGSKILELLTTSGVLSTSEAGQLKQLLIARDQTTIAAFVVAVNDEDWSALSGRLKMILVMHTAKGSAPAVSAPDKADSSQEEPLDIMQEFTSVLTAMAEDKLLTPAHQKILLSLYQQRDNTLMQALQAWATASGEETERITALQERLQLIAQYWSSRLELAEAERQLAEVETARRMLGVEEDGDITNEEKERYTRAHISEVNSTVNSSDDDTVSSDNSALDHDADMYASPPNDGLITSVSSTVESITTKVGDTPAVTTTLTSTTVNDGEDEDTETNVTFHTEGDEVAETVAGGPQKQLDGMHHEPNDGQSSETISIPITDAKPVSTEALTHSISDMGVAVDSLYDGEA